MEVGTQKRFETCRDHSLYVDTILATTAVVVREIDDSSVCAVFSI